MMQILRDMLTFAEARKSDEEKTAIAELVKRIIDALCEAPNSPENMTSLGYMFADEWNNGTWEYDSSVEDGSLFSILDLGSYGADECFGAATLSIHDRTE